MFMAKHTDISIEIFHTPHASHNQYFFLFSVMNNKKTIIL